MSKYRVAVVLQESTDLPGRWKTLDTRLVTDPTNDRSNAEMIRVVAVVAAQDAGGMLAEATYKGDPS